MVLTKWAKVVLVWYGICKNVVGYGKRYPMGGVVSSCVDAWRAAGGANAVGGRHGGNSDKRVSRHQKLYFTCQEGGVGRFTRKFEEALTGKTTRNPRYPVHST